MTEWEAWACAIVTVAHLFYGFLCGWIVRGTFIGRWATKGGGE